MEYSEPSYYVVLDKVSSTILSPYLYVVPPHFEIVSHRHIILSEHDTLQDACFYLSFIRHNFVKLPTNEKD